MNIQTGIVATINDVAAVMKKNANYNLQFNQLCYTHAIHLAVTNVLDIHDEVNEAEAKINVSSQESEDEDEYKYNDYEDSICYVCN
ncbi:hypothetical protein TNCV_2799811 [Trichonephila clavipes]|nr:hypothetical protein TNCV_2799811 [Trichonephila clavipes]